MTKPPVNITKLRTAFKKINTLGNILNHNHHRSSGAGESSSVQSQAVAPVESAPVDDVTRAEMDKMLTVYVGKTRRPYRVNPDLLEHPVMQEIVETSDGSDEIFIACEVVLFDHLRWLIQNSDPQLERLDELADFYTY